MASHERTGGFEADFREADPLEITKEMAGGFCPNCGGAVIRNRTGRPKTFCCRKCCREFWRDHPRPERGKTRRMLVCPVCGGTFAAKQERSRTRKYCSHACANRARGGLSGGRM